MADGIVVRHPQAHSQIYLVPVASKPLVRPFVCPSCQVIHPVKTIHLWLDDKGEAIVSDGVLADLETAGLAKFNLTKEHHVPNPPTLHIAPGLRREEVDQRNRRIRVKY